MARFAIPEILRTPLESLFLQVKSMDPDADVKQYLLYVTRLEHLIEAGLIIMTRSIGKRSIHRRSKRWMRRGRHYWTSEPSKARR